MKFFIYIDVVEVVYFSYQFEKLDMFIDFGLKYVCSFLDKVDLYIVLVLVMVV